MEKLNDKLSREVREEEAKALADFEEYRQRALRETKNRQVAELASRSDLSSDETQKVSIYVVDRKMMLFICCRVVYW